MKNPDNKTTYQKPKIITVVGPTSSGKSDLAVKLAKKHDGEVISADSRQIYTGLDIATGKITENEMEGVPHHMLSVANPKSHYTAAMYKKDAQEAMDAVIRRDKLPILCGGTGMYVQTIASNIVYPEVPPNPGLRSKLKNKTTEELFNELKEKDPDRAFSVDPQNPRRIIRALEIAEHLGKVPKIHAKDPKYDILQIGLVVPEADLRKRIAARTEKRIEAGMIKEAEHLYKNRLSLERMKELGLEYRLLAEFLEGSLDEKNLKQEIQTANYQYARRQMRWFKRDTRIKWFDYNNLKDIFKEADNFLK